jgi:hypothetical protein
LEELGNPLTNAESCDTFFVREGVHEMSNIEITRDIVVAAINSGYPRVVKSADDGYSNNYAETIKVLIKEVHSAVKLAAKG